LNLRPSGYEPMKWGLRWFLLVDIGTPKPRPRRQFTEESQTEKDE
jgi:hypothetical protein